MFGTLCSYWGLLKDSWPSECCTLEPKFKGQHNTHSNSANKLTQASTTSSGRQHFFQPSGLLDLLINMQLEHAKTSPIYICSPSAGGSKKSSKTKVQC